MPTLAAAVAAQAGFRLSRPTILLSRALSNHYISIARYGSISYQKHTFGPLRAGCRPSIAKHQSIPAYPSSNHARIGSTTTRAPKVPQNPVVWFCIRCAAWLGTSVVVVGLGVVGFFLYDASTYKDEADIGEIRVSDLALNPPRGGPKNLPVAEVLIDDNDTEEMESLLEKPKLVILGAGWGSVALLKHLNPEYHVTVIAPQNYFLFTPMLPSATVGTLEMRSLVEPIRRIIARVKGHFIRAKAEDVDFSNKLVEVSQTDANGNESRFYVPYDKLVIAVGSTTNPHGVKGLEHCHFLKKYGNSSLSYSRNK